MPLSEQTWIAASFTLTYGRFIFLSFKAVFLLARGIEALSFPSMCRKRPRRGAHVLPRSGVEPPPLLNNAACPAPASACDFTAGSRAATPLRGKRSTSFRHVSGAWREVPMGPVSSSSPTNPHPRLPASPPAWQSQFGGMEGGLNAFPIKSPIY